MRLAARLARAAGLVHPMDWVKVYESHTAYEWDMQRALAIVDPWGDARSDKQAAIMSAVIAAAAVLGGEEAKQQAFLNSLNLVTKFFETKLPEE